MKMFKIEEGLVLYCKKDTHIFNKEKINKGSECKIVAVQRSTIFFDNTCQIDYDKKGLAISIKKNGSDFSLLFMSFRSYDYEYIWDHFILEELYLRKQKLKRLSSL